MSAETVVYGPLSVVVALGELVMAGRVGGCVTCRGSTIWSHSRVGAIHPACVPGAVEAGLFEGPAAEPVPVVARGAYARRATRLNA